ncbi:DNA-binding protein [Flavobacterium faecale]|uniref:DNA-binding protein n=2 Tax=Flavobacterium faecale TaxID=1355330 RepID=A0A2S1LJ77_9FLAO|nr:DNA-binding protein [Flavobacterium faecale]
MQFEQLVLVLKKALSPLYLKIDEIDSKIDTNKKNNFPKYYRNEDLKNIFGLSSNTIIKYRQTGILPFTKMGDIFLYDAAKIERSLKESTNG